MSDHLHELLALLKQVGATPTLYGKPVTESELRQYVNGRIDEKLERLVRKPKDDKR